MSGFLPLIPLSRPHRFRLGTTSYVYPADILANLEGLAPIADDVELVFFESEEFSNIPDSQAVRSWLQLAQTHNLTFTVHFPIDKAIGSSDPEERRAFLDRALNLIRYCSILPVHGWILHLEGIQPTDSPERVAQWRDDIRPLLAPLIAAVGDPHLLCVENLGYPFEWCAPLLEEFHFSVCLDFGHLWQMGYDWHAHTRRWLPLTRIIHLYGTDHTSRHYSLARESDSRIRETLASIGDYDGVLTLETFGFEDTDTSLRRLEACLA